MTLMMEIILQIARAAAAAASATATLLLQ